MAEDFAPLNLRARLNAVRDKIVQTRTSLEANGIVGDQLDELSGLADEHDRIQGSLDSEGTTVTELQHGKASALTEKLEKALHSWLQKVDDHYAQPTQRKPNVSM